MTSILADTSFLVAINSNTDTHHQEATIFIRSQAPTLLIPQVATTETAYLLGRDQRHGHRRVIAFMKRLVDSKAKLQSIELEDLDRARQIMAQYVNSKFDFVDCCLMALSERLNITRICTYDRRDFSIFRPAHTEYLELLP